MVAEVEALAADGVREVTLLGQNVNSYGRDLPREGRATFAELLREAAAVDGIWRVRYTSPHPKDMRDDVIAAMAECSRSASTSTCRPVRPCQVLKAMRRTYSRERYLDLVARLRGDPGPVADDGPRRLPGRDRGGLRPDALLVEECRYDGAYTFLYSPRPGTEAHDRLEDDVPSDAKREQIGRLVEVAAHRRRAGGALRGHDREALVEGGVAHDPSRLRGRLSQNIAVNFTGTAEPGTLARVRIEAATSTTLTGREARVGAEVAVPA